MNITFRMQKGRENKHGKTVVMLDITWHNQRMMISSRKLIRADNFTPGKKKLVATAEDNSLALNWYFQQLKLNIESDYLSLEREKGQKSIITVEEVRAIVVARTGAELVAPVKEKRKNIWDHYKRWAELYSHKYSKTYVRKFKSIKFWLDDYAPDLYLEDIDEEWVQEYVGWLLVTPSKRTGKVPRNGTIARHLIFFRAMLRFARLSYDWLRNDYNESTSHVDLRYEEVMAIYNTTHLNEELQHTAEQYVLLTQLGLRYSDWLRLSQQDVESIDLEGKQVLVYYQYRQGKTSEPVTVAFSPLATEIWERHNGVFTKIANQTFNRHLKTIGRTARLSRVVAVTTVSGKEYTTEHKPLWKLLTAHTARHTAASLLRKATGDNLLAQQTLGHNNPKTTDIYAHPEKLAQIKATLAAWEALKPKTKD